MPKVPRLGKLPPRYKFILNAYPDTKLSLCPLCNKQTHKRKFVLFVHIDGWGPMALGKTGPYCSPCELIMVHQDELEMELVIAFTNRKQPEVIGNKYFVVGTVDKKLWQSGLTGVPATRDEILSGLADFKKVYNFTYDPGGWEFKGPPTP